MSQVGLGSYLGEGFVHYSDQSPAFNELIFVQTIAEAQITQPDLVFGEKSQNESTQLYFTICG